MAIHHAAASGVWMQTEQSRGALPHRSGNFTDQHQPISGAKGDWLAICRQNTARTY